MKAHQSALIDALYRMNLLFTPCLFFLPHTVQGFVSRPAVSQRKSTLRVTVPIEERRLWSFESVESTKAHNLDTKDGHAFFSIDLFLACIILHYT